MIAVNQHDLTAWWAPALAFVAGTVSFASPCVLPLVPGYVSLITAGRAGQEPDPSPTRRPAAPILLFIVGFALVFTLLGAASATWVPRLRGPVGQKVSGGFVALMGLLMLAYAFGAGEL